MMRRRTALIPWTPDEEKTMKRHYKTYAHLRDLMALLPGRTETQIRSKAAVMGIKRGRPVGTGKTMKYVPLVEPLDRDKDARHVTACMAEGGFPASHLLQGRTVWTYPIKAMAQGSAV